MAAGEVTPAQPAPPPGFQVDAAPPPPPGFKLAGASDPKSVPDQGTPAGLAAPTRSLAHQIVRQLGLTARHGIEGATGIGGMLADAPVNVANLFGAGITPPSAQQSNLLTKIGLPSPENQQERLVGAGARGMAGAGSTVIPAQAAKPVSDLARSIVGQTAAKPGAQAASGAAGGVSGQGAVEAGAGPLGELAASVAGSMAGNPLAARAGQAANAVAGRTGAPGAAAGEFMGLPGKEIPAPPQNQVRSQTLAEAKKAGFVVTPSEASPGGTNSVLESIPGKQKVAQKASIKNQDVRNRLGQNDLALGEEPLSVGSLDRVRTNAYKDYERLAKADYGGQGIQTTPEFQSAVQKAMHEATTLAKEFPGSVDTKDIAKVVADFNKAQFTPDGALGIVKRLRNQSTANLRNAENYEKAELGRFQYKIAQAMEDLIEQNLGRVGKPGLMQAFKDARQTIAKSYDIEYAMNPATGDLSAQRLVSLAKAGKPLSGGLKQAADFAQAFPKDNMDVARIGGQPAFSPWDFLVAGGAAVAGHPGVAAAELASRGGIPSVLLSKPYQERFTTPPSKPRDSGPSGRVPAAINQLSQRRGEIPPPPQ